MSEENDIQPSPDFRIVDCGIEAPDTELARKAAFNRAFAAFQAEVPDIVKNKTARVTPRNGGTAYTYLYADIADVLAAARPVLAKHGLALTQPIIYEGNRLVIETILLHESGYERNFGRYPVCDVAPDHKTMGAALTYARRYHACTTLGIASDEDTDNGETGFSERGDRPRPRPRPSDNPGGNARPRPTPAAAPEPTEPPWEEEKFVVDHFWRAPPEGFELADGQEEKIDKHTDRRLVRLAPPEGTAEQEGIIQKFLDDLYAIDDPADIGAYGRANGAKLKASLSDELYKIRCLLPFNEYLAARKAGGRK